MKNTSLETIKNIRTHLEKASHNMVSEMFGKKKGFITQVLTTNRLYWLVFKVFDEIDKMTIEVYPEINCNEAYRAQVCEFIAPINAKMKICNIRVDDHGSVYAHIEHSIKDCAASTECIGNLERVCVSTMFEHEEDIDLLAHGRLVKPKSSILDRFPARLPKLSELPDLSDLPKLPELPGLPSLSDLKLNIPDFEDDDENSKDTDADDTLNSLSALIEDMDDEDETPDDDEDSDDEGDKFRSYLANRVKEIDALINSIDDDDEEDFDDDDE